MHNLVIIGAGGFGKHLKSNLGEFDNGKYNFDGFLTKI